MLSLQNSILLLSSGFLLIFGLNYIYLKINKKLERKRLMNNVMGSIYIIFAILKLINLNKFTEIFSKYDIISKNIPIYAYLYPFIELALGIAFLKKYQLNKIHLTSLFIMIVSVISVLISLTRGEKLRCGCLGSFFHIPLSYVTLSENFVMIIMSTMHFLPSSF